MRLELLIAHNKYRGLVKNPYPQSMPAVVWDDYLEKETQKYTDKCAWGHSSSGERAYIVNSLIHFFPSQKTNFFILFYLYSFRFFFFLKGRNLRR